MKLIMENWRKFTSESVITIDETQMQPKFLKEFILSEDLIEEDGDPQSLSLAELQEMKPEVVIAAYEEMKKNETSERVGARVKRYRTLKSKLSDAELEMQGVEFDKKYGSPVLSNFFDTIKKITNAIFRTSYKTSKQKADQTTQNYEQAVKDLKQIMIDSYTPLQRELFRAIGLFTGANYPTIRNPDKFNPKKANALKFINDGIVDMFKPSKETYQKAKVVLQKLVQSKIKPVPVWRGLSMNEKSKTGGWAGLDAYKKGATINVGNMSSFSTDKMVAYKDFMEGTFDSEQNQWGTVLHIPRLTRGADVDDFSRFEGSEKEIIVSGEFQIRKVEFHPKENYDQKQEITSLSHALKTPNPPRSEEHVILVTLEEIR